MTEPSELRRRCKQDTMKITKTGHYRLTRDFKTRGTISIGTIPSGTVIEITQIDDRNNKVIGPSLHDWTYNDMPVEPIADVGISGGA